MKLHKISVQALLLTFLSFSTLVTIAESVSAPTTAMTTAPGVPAAPDVAVRAYILIDFNSGSTLLDLKADERMEPASLTKLMTAYVVFEELKAGRIKLENQITISEKLGAPPAHEPSLKSVKL